MASDASLLLSRDDIHLTVAGATIRIPFAPAATWLNVLDQPDYLIFGLADQEGKETLLSLLVDTPGADQAIRTQSRALIKRVTGRERWWEAVRLAYTGASPGFLGHLVLAGVDANVRTIGEWCASVYTVSTRNADDTGRIRFDMSIALPPEGLEDEWDDGNDFESMQADFRDFPGMS